ncbi:hypothetical protein H0H87_011063 [Tephrocybe sp. NHM501043]|nr:hypothetical protein H0H87_011063 [Tephrocybe sp. NHM501043]
MVAYGVPGVVKIVQLLRREIITAMRLLGACSVQDLKPQMVGCNHIDTVFDYSQPSYQVERIDWQPLLHSKL